jgi:peptide/nickel transport system substrate-binding protein
MKRIILLASALLLVAGTALFAGGGGESMAIGQSALRVAIAGEPKSVAAWHTGSWNDQIPGRSIYQGLVALDYDSMQPVGLLAESWEWNDDGTAVTFNLRRGVKFHDGTDVNADAVKFTIDRYMMETVPPDDRPSLRRSQFAPVQSFEKVDDYTVRFTLNEPLRPFLAQLTQRPGMILSPTAVQADPQDFERNPVGSGPFIISRWQHNANIELTRNPDYWNPDEPHLDAVRVFHTVDPTVELAMIRTGEVDFAESIRQADVTLVQDRSDLVLEENFGGRYEIIIFRLGDGPPWDNRNFRRALAYATDREELVETQWEGHGAPAYIPIGPAFGVWHNPDMQPLKYDLQAAKNELAQAGYPNGIDIPLPCPATTERLQHCEVLRELWAPAGINATIDSRPASGHWGSWVQGDFSMIVSWRAARPDPHINIQRVFHSQGFSNPMRYNNPQVDVLIDQAGAEYDVSAAKLLYDQVQDLVVNDAVEIYQAYPSEYHVRKQELKGYGFYLNGAFRFRDWWLER